MTLNRRILAGATAAVLTLGLAACSQNEVEDAAGKAGDAAASATEKAGEAAASATEKAGEAMDSATETETETATATATETASATESESAAADADANMTEVETTSNGTVKVPTDLAAAIGQSGANVTEVTEKDGAFAAFLDNNRILTYSADTDVQPLIGKIGETWVAEGGLESEVGLPTAPEELIAPNEGWTQEFVNGTIKWIPDASGTYGADIETK